MFQFLISRLLMPIRINVQSLPRTFTYFYITLPYTLNSSLFIIIRTKRRRSFSTGKFTCARVISRRSHFVRELCGSLCGSFTGIQDERVSPHIYDKHLNARARCADTNPLPRGLSATYSSRYTARKIILVLKWRIIPRDVFNDAPYTRFVPETARCAFVLQKVA